MNEENIKYENARKGLTKDQIAALDLEKSVQAIVEDLALTLQADRFSQHYDQCLAEAKKQIYSDITLLRPPSKTCVFFERTLENVKGKRITAQKLRGVALANKFVGGGNKEYPIQSFKLYDDMEIYLQVWGNKTLWNADAIQRAKDSYKQGFRPWFCQECGLRTCSTCGSPWNVAVASDLLYGDGSNPHMGIYPVSGAGCTNNKCAKYKKCC